MSIVYKLVEFNLIGKMLYSIEEMPELEKRESSFYYKGTNNKYPNNNLWMLTTTKKEGAISASERFMPYFADVTEDLPGSVRKMLKPKTYKNCQLLTQKHGGYLQFWHEESQQVLRIAMNSHYYTPVN